MRLCCLLCCVLLLAACNPGSVRLPSGNAKAKQNAANEVETPEPEPDTRTTDALLEDMRKDIAEVAARRERPASNIEVQHLLVSFRDTNLPGVTRSREEAEKLAAELYAKIKAGADFDELVKQHTNDSHPGIYAMCQPNVQPSPGVTVRTGMVPAFGDVGWRLDVGEVGVAPFDQRKSHFGWHIIKRLK